MVAQAAGGLAAGEDEGLVLVFPRGADGAQASLRKWKNSAEGGGAARAKDAQALRRVDARALADAGQLDARVADMVEAMIRVAEARTAPRKVGRSRVSM